jgi:hypothetical protein
MQVYAGMDVITNKIPISERQGVEHLLMDFKSPGQQYIVSEWVRDAMDAVSTSLPQLAQCYLIPRIDQRDAFQRSDSDRGWRYHLLDTTPNLF